MKKTRIIWPLPWETFEEAETEEFEILRDWTENGLRSRLLRSLEDPDEEFQFELGEDRNWYEVNDGQTALLMEDLIEAETEEYGSLVWIQEPPPISVCEVCGEEGTEENPLRETLCSPYNAAVSLVHKNCGHERARGMVI